MLGNWGLISPTTLHEAHTDRITGTAKKPLGFVKRNIKTKMPGVRETVYTTLVRPQLEYGTATWDPHHKEKTNLIEKIKWRTELIEALGWHTLEQKCVYASLSLL